MFPFRILSEEKKKKSGGIKEHFKAQEQASLIFEPETRI